MDLQRLVRENIARLRPYSSARNEFAGAANIYLDANENNFGSPIVGEFYRYPDPMQIKIKEKLSFLNGVDLSEIFIGNGSDEAIDLLFRIFCEPGKDNALICPPTYGMYKVSAEINDVTIREASLTDTFELNLPLITSLLDKNTKLIFLCSPNNPTGNSLEKEAVLRLVENFTGIVVIDEAYIHFSQEDSFISEIGVYENLAVLQTFSKAWGLAGLRVGTAFANRNIVELFNKVKPPYNVSSIAQREILNALDNYPAVEKTIAKIINERKKMMDSLSPMEAITKIYPSDANFLLVKTRNADSMYQFLMKEKIVVRNRNNVEMCDGCLRITVGTPEENEGLVKALRKFEGEI